ncbi:MAG TPA: amidohydrolase family protein, partial [Flavisolibacter sp.]|nr:amidohydrolase family protein [Flavisolibacter sp.]
LVMSIKTNLYILFSLIFQQASAQIAVKGDTVYTVAGKPIANGVVLINNGKIEAVGTNLQIPQGYTVYTAKIVTPGLIDARSVVGFSGSYNSPFDQDQLEKSSPIQPELRAIDAYNPEDKLVEYVRKNGITTLHTGHGLGALISGQTMVVKTKPGITEEVTVLPLAMVAMTLGPTVSGNFTSPGTKGKQMAMLRTEFLKAQLAMKKDTVKTVTDLKQQMLQLLLKREVKALIEANTSVDIMSAIRLAKEFNLKLVIEGAAEAYRLIDQIKSSNAEIIVHATMERAGGETQNITMENAAILTKAGIPVSIESGYEGYVPKTRIVLFEAAIAMVHGLPYEEALKAITINPARLLGLDKKIGSLEKGKDADLVLFNGDPFEYVTKPCIVIIDGKVEVNQCK